MVKKRKIEQNREAQGNTEIPALQPEMKVKEEIEQNRANSLQLLQSFYFCFTLNNYTNEDIIILQEIMKVECDWFVFQEEIGESGTPHLQGTLKLKKKKRLTELKKWHQKVHWESTRAVKDSIVYCTAQSKRSGNVYSYGVDIPEDVEVEEPYGWQLDVMNIIREKPDKRKVHWFWEPDGNKGKSTLTKYLVIKHDAIVVSGKSSDIKHALMKRSSIKLVIFDVPRSNLEFINYQTIEEIKNGLIFSGKYDSGQKVFNSPHLIIFANEPPCQRKLSEDRWDIRRIS